jgi:hypothetical protein
VLLSTKENSTFLGETTMSQLSVFNPTKQGIIHPEQRQNEVFLGNFDPAFAEKLLVWKTKRLGVTAYQEDGVPYPKTIPRKYRPIPVFVDRSEALERHYAMIHGKNKK